MWNYSNHELLFTNYDRTFLWGAENYNSTMTFDSSGINPIFSILNVNIEKTAQRDFLTIPVSASVVPFVISGAVVIRVAVARLINFPVGGIILMLNFWFGEFFEAVDWDIFFD